MLNSKLSYLKNFVDKLKLSPFGALNGTQILGAMNDNIFKLLIVYCFISVDGEASSNIILAAVGALYVIPFLLLSSTAGTMADRFSKRTIIVAVKCAEVVVMSLGMFSFYLASKALALCSLFLLACHSTLFAPCKYGIVPEIVPPEKISKANGLLTSCTYGAIIVGTFLASFLTDISSHNFMIASSAAIFFALLGLIFSLYIPKTPSAGSEKEISPRFISELFCNLKLIVKQPSLLSAVLGSAFFLFVGSYTQLNMIPFAIDALQLSDVQGGYLFLLTALGIGGGSLLAGKLSGKGVELGLVPIGGAGIALSFFLLSFCTQHLFIEILLITLIGVCGGFYLVPLDTYIQVASPKTLRGQVIATTNFLGFFGVLCSAAMLYFLSEIIGLKASTGFFVMGILSLIFVTGITCAISGYVMRFIYMLISRYFYKATVLGAPPLVFTKPTFYLSKLSPWPWKATLAAAQGRRILFFTFRTAPRSLPGRIMQRLAFKREMPKLEDLEPDALGGAIIKKALSRGTSIAIFCSKEQENAAVRLVNKWAKLTDSPAFLFQRRNGTGFHAELTKL